MANPNSHAKNLASRKLGTHEGVVKVHAQAGGECSIKTPSDATVTLVGHCLVGRLLVRWYFCGR